MSEPTSSTSHTTFLNRLRGLGRLGREPSLRRKGMTLIEIMIVVTIMAAIMGVVGWFVIGQSTKADIELTKTQVNKIKTAVEAYRLYYKKYPEKLEDLVNTPDGTKLMDEIPKDPWGNDYVYEKSSRSAKIFSAGPDGTPNNDDDIVATINE